MFGNKQYKIDCNKTNLEISTGIFSKKATKNIYILDNSD